MSRVESASNLDPFPRRTHKIRGRWSPWCSLRRLPSTYDFWRLVSGKSRGRFVCNSFTWREGEKLAGSRGSSYRSSSPRRLYVQEIRSRVFVPVSSTLLRGCFVTKPRKREKWRDIKAGWKVAGGIEILRVNLRGRLLRLKGYRLIRCCAAGIIKGRLDVA